jgi:hypothetical protein
VISSIPDLEVLSHSEANIQMKILGVLLGDDYRARFLPGLMKRAGLAQVAAWESRAVEAVSFTRPLRVLMRERASEVEGLPAIQEVITHFLGLPAMFQLRRNIDGKLTHPRGWNRRYIAEMLDGNPRSMAHLTEDLIEARLWLLEELADTQVDLILQARETLIFCAVRWLSGLWRSSRKPELQPYHVTEMDRQYLVGRYLEQAEGCTVYQMALTCSADEGRRQQVSGRRLRELVPSAEPVYTLYRVTWQDVYEEAVVCLPPDHGLMGYMAGKRARRGDDVLPLVADIP